MTDRKRSRTAGMVMVSAGAAIAGCASLSVSGGDNWATEGSVAFVDAAPAVVSPFVVAAVSEDVNAVAARRQQGAQPELPPVWDPNWVPEGDLDNVFPANHEFGFDAIPSTGWTPPDPEIAVGKNNIVCIVNGQIAFFDKNGTNTFRDEIENNFGFWGSLGATNFVFDPEVIYDPFADRFWAMACERGSNNRSYYLLAVSDDGDPNGNWHKWRLDATTVVNDNDIDSPNFAVDNKAVYLTADFFGPDKFHIWSLEKAPMLGGAMGATHSEVISGASQQSMGIPVTHDAAAPAQYIIQSTELSNNTTVIFHAIRNPFTGHSRQTFTLPVPDYRYPAAPPQRGTTSRPTLFEPRFWSCVYRNGSLWAVHHITTAGNSRTHARWYEFDMRGWPTSGNTPTIKQWGAVDGGGNTYAFFPSIGVDQHGNAAITTARSSTDEYISMWRAIRRSVDPAGTFRPMDMAKESFASHTSGRWGDYSGTKDDPGTDGCILWGHHEWTQNGQWRTWVSRYELHARADLNKDCRLDIRDFFAFQSLYAAGDSRADFDGNRVLDIRDFFAFQAAFSDGR